MIERIVLSITIKVRSPFLFPGLDGARFGLDACALRDSDHTPLIPADQVRGVLKHALCDLRDTAGSAFLNDADLHCLFGKVSGDAMEGAVDNEPIRGSLQFNDLIAQEIDDNARASNRVRIDEETGAAANGALVFLEQVAALGKDVEFKGNALLFAPDKEAGRYLDLLKAAKTYVSSIGAMKSAGYGEVSDFAIAEVSRSRLVFPTPASAPNPGRKRCTVTIDRPFLVDARRQSDNVYVGSEVIPGGALKGALARSICLMGRDPTKMDSLSKLQISHAHPARMPQKLPLSIVINRELEIGDALRVPYGKGALINGEAARFLTDWKAPEREAVVAHFAHQYEPMRRDPRMHVEIKRATGTALEHKLFLTNAVDPEKDQWVFDADFSAVNDPIEAQALANVIAGGLDGVGGTAARLDIVSDVSVSDTLVAAQWPEECFAVVLKTDAVMAGPDDGDAVSAYKAYWQRICPGSELVNFYASQRLGGGYAAMRFRVDDTRYRPFWLTEAGSVFLLRGDIENQLDALQRSGLPAPVIGGVQTTWDTCPFQPENGYGAIRTDYDSALTEKVDHV